MDRSIDTSDVCVVTECLFVFATTIRPSAMPEVKREQLVADIRNALYCSKICSYAQGMNLIKEASQVNGWGVDLGEAARIWKAGCIIRAGFLDRIKCVFVCLFPYFFHIVSLFVSLCLL